MNFAEARALEAFKSLTHIAVPGLKLLALLNGGAAVALLAYLGNVAGKVHQPLTCMSPCGGIWGVSFCADSPSLPLIGPNCIYTMKLLIRSCPLDAVTPSGFG